MCFVNSLLASNNLRRRSICHDECPCAAVLQSRRQGSSGVKLALPSRPRSEHVFGYTHGWDNLHPAKMNTAGAVGFRACFIFSVPTQASFIVHPCTVADGTRNQVPQKNLLKYKTDSDSKRLKCQSTLRLQGFDLCRSGARNWLTTRVTVSDRMLKTVLRGCSVKHLDHQRQKECSRQARGGGPSNERRTVRRQIASGVILASQRQTHCLVVLGIDPT